ncbi:hypothetical protein ACOI1H_19980 [Loktanella sp. DJP18]|uniref:hypothetical protein n=1 Tax=Loktanella sp. DJP18 TaxID=3409788 RepID=UPI003BB4CB0A
MQKTDMKAVMGAPRDISIFPSAGRLSVLSNRWREIHRFALSGDAHWISKGLTFERAVECQDMMAASWLEFDSALVQDNTNKALHILLEGRLIDLALPQGDLNADIGDDLAHAWQKAITAHAPALLRAADDILTLSDPDASDITVFFNASVHNRPAAGILIPIHAMHLYDDVRNAAADGTPLRPSSAHEQLTALSRIRWHFDPRQIPIEAVPPGVAP